MLDPRKMAVVEVRIVFADGSQDERYWCMDDGPPVEFDQPDWMKQPRKTWNHPQDPIVFSALVAEGREDDARAWLDEQGGRQAAEVGRG